MSALAIPRGALRAELIKLRSLRSTWVTLALAAAVSLGLSLVDAYTAATDSATWTARERAAFEPVQACFGGLAWAELAFALVGVLSVSSEYGTGTICSSLLAVPHRRRLLAAKTAVVASAAFVVGEALALSSFALGRHELASRHLDVSLRDPHVLRAVVAAGAYLAALAVIGVCLGAIVRHTPGALAALFALLYLAYGAARSLETWSYAPDRWLLESIGDAITRLQPPADASLADPAVALTELAGTSSPGSPSRRGGSRAIRRAEAPGDRARRPADRPTWRAPCRALLGRSARRSCPAGCRRRQGPLRRDYGVNLDDLLLDAGNDSLDVLAEPAVVLLLALPDLGDGEGAALVHEGDVVEEARRSSSTSRSAEARTGRTAQGSYRRPCAAQELP